MTEDEHNMTVHSVSVFFSLIAFFECSQKLRISSRTLASGTDTQLEEASSWVWGLLERTHKRRDPALSRHFVFLIADYAIQCPKDFAINHVSVILWSSQGKGI